jgi:hypothetical protein
MQTEEVEPIEGLRSALDQTIKKVPDGEAMVADTIVRMNCPRDCGVVAKGDGALNM